MIVALGCGAPPVAGPPANVRTAPDPPPPEEPVVENCEPNASGHEPGNHDRYAFEDPVTNLYGYKNKAGVIVIGAIYPSVYEFTPKGIAGVVNPGHKASPFAFIDPTGRVIARAYPFDNGPDYFQEGRARIVDDQKRIGFIDESGAIVVPPKFTSAEPYCHGKAHVEFGLDKYWIDRKGNRVAPPPDA